MKKPSTKAGMALLDYEKPWKYEVCPEEVHHGPGGQSHTNCQIDFTYPHTIHYAVYGEFSDHSVWRTDDAVVSNQYGDLYDEYERESNERVKLMKKQERDRLNKAILAIEKEARESA